VLIDDGGASIEDQGSLNGTFVNARASTTPRSRTAARVQIAYWMTFFRG
jgi:pSer/pThr/pTyr-binding forkhead associated (FHA) protein